MKTRKFFNEIIYSSVRGTPSEKVGTPAHDEMTTRVKTTDEVATLL